MATALPSSMSANDVTKAAHESADMDRAIRKIVDTFKGMQWLIVDRTDFRIVGAAYDMRDARNLMPKNSMVKNVHTGRVVAVRA